MTEGKENCRLLWQKTEKKEAKVLRIYGESPNIILPEQIAGYPLTQIGAYCFSAFEHLPEKGSWEDTYLEADGSLKKNQTEADLHELSGNYVESVFLPGTVREIENCAFYNCSRLKKLSIGCGTQEFGSDVFMNCRNFDRVSVRCGIEKKTGIRQLLHRISSNMEVCFLGEDGPEAVLVYPEYSEAYDEITPAHVFGRKITGEGFRARQCFTDGVVNLQQYDEVFPKACVEESEKTLARMALNRLCYPKGLTGHSRDIYEAYIKEHARNIGRRLVNEKNLERLSFLCEKHYFSEQEVIACIEAAAEAEWTEGTAALMRWKREYDTEDKAGRYQFDAF